MTSMAAGEVGDLAGTIAGIVESGKKLTDSCPAGTFKAPPYKCGQMFAFVKLSDASPTPESRGYCEHYNERCCAKVMPATNGTNGAKYCVSFLIAFTCSPTTQHSRTLA